MQHTVRCTQRPLPASGESRAEGAACARLLGPGSLAEEDGRSTSSISSPFLGSMCFMPFFLCYSSFKVWSLFLLVWEAASGLDGQLTQTWGPTPLTLLPSPSASLGSSCLPYDLTQGYTMVAFLNFAVVHMAQPMASSCSQRQALPALFTAVSPELDTQQSLDREKTLLCE